MDIYQELSLPHFETARVRIQNHLDAVKGYKVNLYNFPYEEKVKIYSQWKKKIDEWGYDKP